MSKKQTILFARALSLLAAGINAAAPVLAQSAKPAAKPPATKPAAKPTAAKPAVKPAPSAGPIVLGTEQLPGDFGQVGTTYTIGRREPLNFTLRSAAYTIEPFAIANNTWVPKADEKLLVLHYTVHNPSASELSVDWTALKFTAVDKTDTNRTAIQAIARDGSVEPLSVKLKPAQKLDLVAAIVVPASGVVPKLIVQREDGAPVIRYDLRGRVKSLPSPIADERDDSGASALASVPAQPQTFYPLGVFDVRLDEVGSVDGPLLRRDAGAGNRWATVIFTLRNRTAAPQTYQWSDFVPELRDADGEKPTWTQALLKATRDEVAYGTLAPGEEARVRFFFPLPKNVAPKTISLAEGKNVHPSVARRFVFSPH